MGRFSYQRIWQNVKNLELGTEVVVVRDKLVAFPIYMRRERRAPVQCPRNKIHVKINSAVSAVLGKWVTMLSGVRVAAHG